MKKKDIGADLEVLPNFTIWVFTRVTVTDGNTLKNQIQEVDSDIKNMDLKQKEEGDRGKFFFTEECQLKNIEGMIELKSHYFAASV